MMNYRDFLQKIIYAVINPLIRGMIAVGITPNMVTTLGFLGNVVAAAFFVLAVQDAASQSCWVGWGGAVILFAGLFDMMDGRLARVGNMSSSFGALWDSTLDRYSELVTLSAIAVMFLQTDWFWMGITTLLALVGSIMVSYVRARAEGVGIGCKVGFMQRPERVVVTALGAIVSGLTGNQWYLAGAMVLIAVGANLTAFWRVAHCRRQLNYRDALEKEEGAHS